MEVNKWLVTTIRSRKEFAGTLEASVPDRAELLFKRTIAEISSEFEEQMVWL